MSQQENYDWIKAFKELKELVKGYRNNQKGLIKLLETAGIDVPSDEYPEKNKVPLEHMDPFSFLSLINKHPNAYRRSEFVNKILGKEILNTEIEHFAGVPTSQGTAALFFPYRYHRKDGDIEKLWDLFECMDDPSKITAQMFQEVLSIHSVGFSKLTQGLFWYAPELYLPIDGQTTPYLIDINFPQAYKIKNANSYSVAWQEYQRCLSQIRQAYTQPFAKISFEAWLQNGKKYSAAQAIQYLEKRYGAPIGSTHIQVFKNRLNREIAVDPILKSVKIFIELMPTVDFFPNIDRVYGISDKRNQHLDTYSEHLGTVNSAVLLKNLTEETLKLLCDWYERPESGGLKERVDQFLSQWAVSSISKLKFKNYYQLNQYDSFARWIDLFDISMGATYGNNFHVWQPQDEKKEHREHIVYQYENKYAWQKSFGQTFDEAFETVKQRVQAVVEFVRNGQFIEIEKIELNDALKWKIAFVYQDFAKHQVYPFFSKEDLKRLGYKSIVNSSSFSYMAAYEWLEVDRQGKDYFEYVKQLNLRILEARMNEMGKKIAKKNNTEEGQQDMNKTDHVLNRILFGAAGTGKTYHTINHALSILDNKSLEELEKEERAKLKVDFDRYVEQGRIKFVTFHQSFSYEDFVEGIRAEVDTESNQLNYRVKSGVFKEICEKATGQYIQLHSHDNNLESFLEEISIKPLMLNTIKNKEFKVSYIGHGHVIHCQPLASENNATYRANINSIREILQGDEPEILYNSSYVYAIANYIQQNFQSIEQKVSKLDPYVLIIDEINRGNISRIFGELITLIEKSKRAGADEALSVTLPYSKREFSVPNNIYIIGTMNSSDRSLTGMDIALRRRFDFIEMPPKPEEIKDKDGGLIKISGKDQNGKEVDVIIADLLSAMNQRIEVLLDRDHCIGHANFMSLKENPTLEHLAGIFKQKIIPQLQEYFFDDWAKINLVFFNNGMIVEDKEINISGLFPANIEQDMRYSEQKKIWKIETEAFKTIDAFTKILGSKS